MALFAAAYLYNEQWLLGELLYSNARPRAIIGTVS